MILVVGSTGVLGRMICRRLVEKGPSVRGLVRATSDPAKVSELQSLGVETVEGNLKDLPSLVIACAGVDTVISTATITASRQPDDTIQNVDQDGQLDLIEAARATHVKHFIYMSYSKNLDAECPLTTAKRSVEQRLIESGIPYTILRPSCFMEVWLSPIVGFDYPNAKATIYGDGTSKLSFISNSDVASFVIAALDNPAARNAILELGGPEALSPLDIVKIFEQASGRPFEVQFVPEAALRGQKAQATDSVAQSFAGLMLAYAKGDVIDMNAMLKTFPLKLTSVAEYAQHVMVSA